MGRNFATNSGTVAGKAKNEKIKLMIIKTN